jgi:transcriptional regulator with XRE-family HTH domain
MADYYTPEPVNLNGRYKPDGGLVRQLRERMGWSREELAALAKCSAGTIANIESGERAYAATLSRIGAVLGKRYQSLLLRPEAAPEAAEQPQSLPKDLVPAAIELDGNLADFDETADLARAIRQLSKALKIEAKKIYVICISEGSIIIELKLPRLAARRLVKRFTETGFRIKPRVIAIRVSERLRVEIGALASLADRIRLQDGFHFSEESFSAVRISIRQPKRADWD